MQDLVALFKKSVDVNISNKGLCPLQPKAQKNSHISKTFRGWGGKRRHHNKAARFLGTNRCTVLVEGTQSLSTQLVVYQLGKNHRRQVVPEIIWPCALQGNIDDKQHLEQHLVSVINSAVRTTEVSQGSTEACPSLPASLHPGPVDIFEGQTQIYSIVVIFL